MAQLRQDLAVVLEIDAQQNRDAEDKLSMLDVDWFIFSLISRRSFGNASI